MISRLSKAERPGPAINSDTSQHQRDFRDALSPGTRLRSYEVISVVGQGGFGITYHARDTILSRDVAIKEFLPTSLARREDGSTVVPRSTELTGEFVWGRDRFLEEARTLARLARAPAVIRVHDFLEANGTAYIVMEMALGETLEQRIKREGSLSPEAVNRILHPLLDGLEQVHGANFLHRDIKPSNIILDAIGNPTLIDFGAARAAMTGRTTAMTAIFSPGYAAAEQFTSAGQGPWTDIYGLSATLCHAITGRPPPSAMDRMLEDTYEPMAHRAAPGFASGLLTGVEAGLRVRAIDRPQSIPEWRAILSVASAGDDHATVRLPRDHSNPSASTASPITSPAKKRLWLWAGAAASILVGTGGAYFALSPKLLSQASALKTEDLEQLLAERRSANTVAAEKKRIEEEAQRQVEIQIAAKRQADLDLEKSRADHLKAEAALAQLKEEMEAQRVTQLTAAEAAARQKIEAEVAATLQAEQDAKRKATVDAENKRQAEETLAKAQAERERADEEVSARRRLEEIAEREAAEKQKAESAVAAAFVDKKAAEAAENELRLGLIDRQRIQTALTSLGFDTRGTDGVLGARTRNMIAGWQTARNLPPTGFVNATQQQALLREAAPALARHDDEQRKVEEAKRKMEDEARVRSEQSQGQARPPAVAAASTARVRPPDAQPFDGRWRGAGTCGLGSLNKYTMEMSVQGNHMTGTATSFGQLTIGSPNQYRFQGRIDSANGTFVLSEATSGANKFSGVASDRQMKFKGWTGDRTCDFTLDKVVTP